MNWKDVAKNIAAIAPTIGTAIGGPAGAVAGMGVKAIASMFGVDPTSDDADVQVQTALSQMTPDQAMQLKAADRQFAADMKKLEVDVFKLEIEDKNSARQMYTATKNPTPTILTYLLIIIAGGIVYMVFTSSLPGLDKTLVGTVIGYVFGELKAATSFWFGSSKGSADKTIQMSEALKRKS